MKRFNWRVRDRFSFTIGTVLVLLGVLLNKWFIESAIVTVSVNLPITIVVQLVLAASGGFLVINQPAFKHPRRSDLILLLIGILVAFLIGDTITRFI